MGPLLPHVAAWADAMPPIAVPPSDGPLCAEPESTLSPEGAGLMSAGYSLEGGPPEAAVGPSAEATEDFGASGDDGFLSHALKASNATSPMVAANIPEGWQRGLKRGSFENKSSNRPQSLHGGSPYSEILVHTSAIVAR